MLFLELLAFDLFGSLGMWMFCVYGSFLKFQHSWFWRTSFAVEAWRLVIQNVIVHTVLCFTKIAGLWALRMDPFHVCHFDLSKQCSPFQNKYRKSFTVWRKQHKKTESMFWIQVIVSWLAQSEATSARKGWPFVCHSCSMASFCVSEIATALSPSSSLKAFKEWKSLFIINI